MAEPNVPLLRKTMEHIIHNRPLWYQGDWRRSVNPYRPKQAEEAALEGQTQAQDAACGTAMCFAGWAAQLDGGQWLDPTGRAELREYLLAEPDDPKSQVRTFHPQAFEDSPAGKLFSGKPVHVVTASNRARRILGLTTEQARELFEGNNSMNMLKTKVKEIINEEFF